MKILDALRIDLRYSIRRLRQSPGLTLTALATIVVVLVANTAIFSLLNAIVLRKVTVANPEELIAISAADARTTLPGYFYLETFKAFRSAQQSFSHLSMYSGGNALRVEPQGMATVTLGVEAVSPDYFALARVRASAGRLIAESDEPAVPVVLLSHRLAVRLYGDAAAATDRNLSISGVATTVVGVVEPGFTGLALDGGSDLFVSFPTLRLLLTNPNPALRAPNLVGRLAEGKSIEEARVELVSRWPSIQESTIGSVPAAVRTTVSTQLLKIETLEHGFSGLRRQYGDALVVVMGLAAVLLALGAINLSGLLLARNLVRQHQFAVQRALGATPARLIRQSVLDGLCLTLGGLVVAMPIAWWVVQRVVTSILVARALPLQRPLTPDANVLAVAALTTVVTGVLIGVLPARRALKASADGVLRSGRAVAGSMGWAGRAMIVAQVALALILVSGAGLFAATLANLYENDSATRTRPILWTRLSQLTSIKGNPPETYLRSLVDALSNVRGVDAAALSFYYPAYLGFPGPLTSTTIARGGTASDSGTIMGMYEVVTPGFFELSGIARVRGRDFQWTDGTAAAPVAIVSASVADRLFPAADPIGHDIQITTAGVTTRLSIVGVVANAPIGRIDEPDVPVVFRPMMQNLNQAVVPMAHVRVNGDVAAARDGYVDAVNSLGRHEVRALFTMDDWVDSALLQQRLVAGVSASSAIIALLLAALGIFGVLAYSVTARVREIGIRMSIGASHATIARMILREGGTVMGIGLAIGLPLAIVAARVVRAQLYGISPDNPVLLAIAVVVFAVIGVIATWLPARRASRIAPVEALRQD